MTLVRNAARWYQEEEKDPTADIASQEKEKRLFGTCKVAYLNGGLPLHRLVPVKSITIIFMWSTWKPLGISLSNNSLSFQYSLYLWYSLSFWRIKKNHKEMGALDHLPDFFDCSGGGSKHKKRKNLQVILPQLFALTLLFLRTQAKEINFLSIEQAASMSSWNIVGFVVRTRKKLARCLVYCISGSFHGWSDLSYGSVLNFCHKR